MDTERASLSRSYQSVPGDVSGKSGLVFVNYICLLLHKLHHCEANTDIRLYGSTICTAPLPFYSLAGAAWFRRRITRKYRWQEGLASAYSDGRPFSLLASVLVFPNLALRVSVSRGFIVVHGERSPPCPFQIVVSLQASCQRTDLHHPRKKRPWPPLLSSPPPPPPGYKRPGKLLWEDRTPVQSKHPPQRDPRPGRNHTPLHPKVTPGDDAPRGKLVHALDIRRQYLTYHVGIADSHVVESESLHRCRFSSSCISRPWALVDFRLLSVGAGRSKGGEERRKKKKNRACVLRVSV